MNPPMTPREKVAQIVRDGMNRLAASQAGARPVVSASKEADRATDAILTALASGSGDHAELAMAIDRLLPISTRETPDYAEVSFGECQAQAMTMEPDTWLALNQLPALLAENAALRAERDEWRSTVRFNERCWSEERGVMIDRATEAERKLAEAVARQLPDISTDGPNEIDNHRHWLARQLLDSKLTANEAYSIVRHFPGISKQAERG